MLKLWSEYDREMVHSIFSPNTTFTKQAGTWGLQGIVEVPNQLNDWVFFVTLSKSKGDYEFDESISEDGVLNWQSQPKQKLDNKCIQRLISQNPLVDAIHLFVRFEKRSKYIYLGKLRYITHDPDREQPVFFQWQLMDWPMPRNIAERLHLKSPSLDECESLVNAIQNDSLKEEPVPVRTVIKERQSVYSTTLNKAKNYVEQSQQNSELGLCGELLVLKHEKEYLISKGRLDLADQVRHVSACDGDGAGYDILSFSEDGSPRYLEVKTTEGHANTPFFISPNELSFSELESAHFVLIRVFEYDRDRNAGKFFSIKGNVTAQLSLTPTAFRAVLKQHNSALP